MNQFLERHSLGDEIAGGDSLTILDLARERQVNPSTILRWILRGLRAPNGHRVHLAASRLGRGWVTSRAALGRFADALAVTDALQSVPIRTSKRRERQSARASAALREQFQM